MKTRIYAAPAVKGLIETKLKLVIILLRNPISHQIYLFIVQPKRMHPISVVDIWDIVQK